ncbi:hypothetical protein ACXR2U_20085 [Jatrophihabitans sp. YIM 134969]
MYVFIWRHLPGVTALRILQVALLIAAVSALLLFVVFPWAEPRLPFDNVTIDEGGNGANTVVTTVTTSVPSVLPGN